MKSPRQLNSDWESDISDKPSHTFIGDTEKQMLDFCKTCGYSLRITRRDGSYYIITRDVNMKRFNIWLEKGKITKVWVG